MYTLPRWALLLLGVYLSSTVLAAKDDELGCISGDCVNGNGTLVEETERGLRTYRGDFLNEKFFGFGRLTLNDEGEVYEGRFMNGKKHGRGTLWTKKGDVYMGNWRNDRRNGMGMQAFHVENFKEGRFTEDTLKKNTENYYGEFKNDVFFGEGTYRWEDGTQYVGKWAANKKHGRGYFDYGTGHKAWRTFEFDKRVYDERFQF
ncbi:MAG: hypothetical protein HOH14_00635 [Gammaproteobacteria bacterium]|nr:hypothetical protein [Gammaproteobacteria bacterium]MBT6041976.1 hypothetical protein [Gammaproteobacteria bacterium]